VAADEVDGAVGQGQGGGVGLAPGDLDPQAGGGRPGDLEHARVEVGAGDRAAGPDPGRGLAGHDAGAAGHVEHALAGPDRGQVQELGGAGGELGRDEVALVGGRPLPLELETLAGHGLLLVRWRPRW
jgi:hypothetical protein